MTEKQNELTPDVFSKMQTGDPIAVYKKAVLGKVWVSVINPFSGEPVEVELFGHPKKNNSKSFVEVWSQKEQVYFERENSPLFKQGYIVKLDEPQKPEADAEEEKDYSEYTRERIEELVTAPFMKFKHELNEIESEPILYRVETIATELERPEKTMQHIRQRIAEVQELAIEKEE